MRITMTTRKPLACGVGFFLWFILNYAWAGSDYKVSSVGTSTSQTGGFPGGSVFSGTLSIDGLPKNLPANSNLASYLTSFSFSDGAGHDYSNTSQNVVTFTGAVSSTNCNTVNDIPELAFEPTAAFRCKPEAGYGTREFF